MHEPEPLHMLTGRDASRLLRGLFVLGVVVLGAIAGIGGFAIGRGGSDVTNLVGRAQVGNRTASIRAAGTSYGVSESVAWIDASGSVHDDGWPACFDDAETELRSVPFGAVTVSVDDAADVTSVVYVDCRLEQP